MTIERVSERKKLSTHTHADRDSRGERARAREWQRLRDTTETETVFASDAAQLGKLVFHIYIYLLVNFLFRCSFSRFRFYFYSLEDQQQPSRSTTQNVLISAGAVWKRFRPVSASQKAAAASTATSQRSSKSCLSWAAAPYVARACE